MRGDTAAGSVLSSIIVDVSEDCARANAASMPAGVLQHPLQIGPESIPLPVAETFKVMVKHPAHRRQRGGEGFKTLQVSEYDL